LRTNDDDDGEIPEILDFGGFRRANGPLFPDGFEIQIDDAIGYQLRLIPSNKIVGRFSSTRDAWPVVQAELGRGIPARCLVLDALFADGDRYRVSSGRILEATARAGLGQPSGRPAAQAAS
jgi:hypothetical protein